MISVLKTGPVKEPVSVDELRAHLRIDAGDGNTLMRSLIASSRLTIEAQSGLRMITQNWQVLLDSWPDNVVELPLWPVSRVSSVKLPGASPFMLDPSQYEVETRSRPALVFPTQMPLPVPQRNRLGIEINLEAGFGLTADDVPDPLRLAVLTLAAHWYDMDDWYTKKGVSPIPGRVMALINGYRMPQL